MDEKRSKRGRQNDRKGDEWEETVARRLRSVYPTARRNEDQRDLPDRPPDVEAGRWSIECKRAKCPPFAAAYREAVDRAAAGQIPAAAIHVDGINRHSPALQLVVLSLETFLMLAQALRDQAKAISADRAGDRRAERTSPTPT